MVQQGRVLAAALSGRGEVDAGEAERILVAMAREFDARLRVVGADFTLLADSSALGPQRNDESATAADGIASADTELESPEIRNLPLYRLGGVLYGLYARVLAPPEPPLREGGFYAGGSKLVGPEIEAALRGEYGSTVRTSPIGRSLVLFSALPIRDGDTVVGAVLVSRSTFQILGSIYELRLATFQVVLLSVIAAVVLSLVLSTTIARPLQRLRQQAADVVDRRGRLTGRFRANERLDEIGDLSRALAELTRRLEGHLRFIEGFASDVSHELKNPLAAIRAATELLAEVEDPAERSRFLGMVQRDVGRLERLLSGVREISRVDASLELQAIERLPLEPLLRSLVESSQLRRPSVPIELRVDDNARDVAVDASPDRLAQVLDNLIDNAASFSPGDAPVEVELASEGGEVVVRVLDRGPGIPAEHREKIFDRFFSYRPEDADARQHHTGLGLSIALAIAESYGGTLAARERPDGGTCFDLRLPRSA